MLARDEPAGGACVTEAMALDRLPFREIWAVDFEFIADPGENPDPVCLVARELRSRRTLRLWRGVGLFEPPPPPPSPTPSLSLVLPAHPSVVTLRSAGPSPSASSTSSPSSGMR